MTAFEIPLSPNPQTFPISLAGVTYQLTVHWCDPVSCWMLDIADSANNMLVSSIAMVTGQDLLAQYPHLEIGGQLFVQSDSDTFKVPQFGDLGISGHLYFVTTP